MNCKWCNHKVAHSQPSLALPWVHVYFNRGRRVKSNFIWTKYQGPHNSRPTRKVSVYALGFGVSLDWWPSDMRKVKEG